MPTPHEMNSSLTLPELERAKTSVVVSSLISMNLLSASFAHLKFPFFKQTHYFFGTSNNELFDVIMLLEFEQISYRRWPTHGNLFFYIHQNEKVGPVVGVCRTSDG